MKIVRVRFYNLHDGAVGEFRTCYCRLMAERTWDNSTVQSFEGGSRTHAKVQAEPVFRIDDRANLIEVCTFSGIVPL